MNVNRQELIKQLVEKHSYTKKAATSIVEDFTDIIIDNLAAGNTVSIQNFGCFDMIERAARQCPNPQTGEMIDIPAHWVPRFFPGKKMKTAVKMWAADEKRGMI